MKRSFVAHVFRGIVASTVVCQGMMVLAQEKIPTEEAQKVSKKLLESFGKPADVPVTVDADPDKCDGYRHGELGFIVLPDRKLTAEVLSAAGAEPIPVGHLWMKGISPVAEGKPIPNAQHRMFTVTVGNNQTVDVAVCLLGARKRDGKLELVLFGNGKTPVLVTALEPDQASTSPITATAQKEDDDTGKVELNLVGKYKAKILMKKAD